MGKLPLVAVGALVLLIAGIVGYLTLGRSSLNNTDSTADETSILADEELKEEGRQGSLREILGLGTNLECTFVDTDTNSNGTVYVGANDKMRGDFVSVSDDTTINGHTIVDGENLYLWLDGENKGFKASLSASEEMVNDINTGSFDINNEVDYKCHNWAPDNSKFILPEGVEFQDFSAIMENLGEMQNNTQGSTEGQCAVCDSLPAESQDQCRQALDC